MRQVARQFLLAGSLYLGYLSCSNSAQAQITSDGTVPTNVSQSGNVFEITGGAQAGGNLFHSFGEFSVPTGNEAFFNNALNIANIISRVTGGSLSSIDGLIKANGGANLILLNPNGINFGVNARLDLGGSFLGSTASSLKFADGTEFSTTNPQNPLLTVSVPVGLQMGQNPGAIRVQGTGHNLSLEAPIFSPFTRGSVTGLKVEPGQTLALVGGDLNLEGGTLTAEEGRIELGSTAQGLVSLSPLPQGWTLGYENVPVFKDVNLSQKALADVSGVISGSIQVQGRRVSVSDGSTILIQNQGNQASGVLNLNASESLEVSGTTADGGFSSGLFTETIGGGKGGDIDISTQQLIVRDGGTIITDTFSEATAGNITIDASESLQIVGFAAVNPNRFSIISAQTFGAGKAGDITVSTKTFTALDGGNLASVTGGIFGTGSGGNVILNASESVELTGVIPGVFTPSQVTAGTGGAGHAGNVKINTQRLVIRDGGRVDASTTATGDAGSVTINASESVEVSGTVPGSRNPSLVISSANILDPTLQQLLRLPPIPSGASGDVTINAGQLRVTDGALVTAKNEGLGNSGNVRINADSIFLDNRGSISAATQSGEGGNIALNANSLLMRRNSQISATAGGTGNGGNIAITGLSPADFVVLLEGSTITANAFQGRGGSIRIDTRALFVCPDCEITASSELGVGGVVEFNTLEPDTQLEVIDLPQEVTKSEEVVALTCAVDGERGQSEFVVTGRGGLPPRPSEPLSSEALVSFDSPSPTAGNPSGSEMATEEAEPTELPPPARSWYINSEGILVLAAQVPAATPYSAGLTTPECHAD
jgi:filamentous hemagglutinin family protein